MQKIRRVTAILLLMLVCASGSGCIALALAGIAGVAGMGVAYHMGEYEGYLAANPPQITDAAGDVLRGLGAKIENEASSWDRGKIDGILQADEEIVIKVRKKSEQMSSITIRVGVFGSEKQSAILYNQIKARLHNE
ncbi:DUF3568 family protein [Planctomycetota bacterium]|nr:DUF3568 family protein [Planctomycetota bacterium]